MRAAVGGGARLGVARRQGPSSSLTVCANPTLPPPAPAHTRAPAAACRQTGAQSAAQHTRCTAPGAGGRWRLPSAARPPAWRARGCVRECVGGGRAGGACWVGCSGTCTHANMRAHSPAGTERRTSSRKRSVVVPSRMGDRHPSSWEQASSTCRAGRGGRGGGSGVGSSSSSGSSSGGSKAATHRAPSSLQPPSSAQAPSRLQPAIQPSRCPPRTRAPRAAPPHPVAHAVHLRPAHVDVAIRVQHPVERQVLQVAGLWWRARKQERHGGWRGKNEERSTGRREAAAAAAAAAAART